MEEFCFESIFFDDEIALYSKGVDEVNGCLLNETGVGNG